MGGNYVFASYENGKFLISWQFKTISNLQTYDRIEVKERNRGGEDIMCAVQLTQSSSDTGTLMIKPVATLNMADEKYYAVYISSSSDKEIAKSTFFTASDDAGGSFDENFLDDNDSCILDIVQIHAVDIPGKENCEIDIEWNFKYDTGGFLSKNDYICVVPAKKVEDLKNVYHEHAYALASGEPSGKLSMQVGGYISSDEAYKVFYLLNHSVKGMINKGASRTFEVEQSVLPHFANPSATKAASLQFNVSTISQYAMQDQIKNMKSATIYNPLLSVASKGNKWSIEIEIRQDDYKCIEQELDMHLEEVRRSDAKTVKIAEMDDFINEIRMTKQITDALRMKPCFLFAGAGISMDAPSSAPSLADLMSYVLEETLKAMPEECQQIAKQFRKTDSSRRPEELTESYHFILEDKLFDLFKLMGSGKPNTNHRTIAKMAKAGKLKAIVTTNFDEYLEQALRHQGVPHTVVCTNEEFKEYYENGCKYFAVLKMHGTISRPETISAVMSHFRISGGFEGYKTMVMHYFIEKFPTLLFGHTGWDFAHASYQEFWEAVGRKGGENIYYLRDKESKGGPLMEKLIGRYVVDRLVIGEGTLPETAISVWERFDAHEAKALRDFHASTRLDHKSSGKKQRKQIKYWLHQIPKCSLLAIIWNESMYLNESIRLKHENKWQRRDDDDDAPNIMTATSAEGVTSHLTELAGQFSKGIITNEVYMEKQKLATIELSLAPLAIQRKKKEELISLCFDTCKQNTLFIDCHDYQDHLPSYLMSIADAAKDDITPIEYINEAINYIVDNLEPHRLQKKRHKHSQILYDLYLTQTNVLRIPENERQEIHAIFERFAEQAMAHNWSEDKVSTQTQDFIIPTVNRIAYNYIDTQTIVSSMVTQIVDSFSFPEKSSNVAEDAHVLALSLHKHAAFGINDLYQLKDIQTILQTFHMDVTKQVPDSRFERIEKKLNENVQPVIDVLNMMVKKKKKSSISAEEVLATFELVPVEILRHFLRNSNSLMKDERRRENCGYYPRDIIPPTAATYLSRKVLKALKHIQDERAQQACFTMLCSFAETTNDVKQMKVAVDNSIALTDGKVNEKTPCLIPETLAAEYARRDDFVNALHYYNMALQGIHTFIPRPKTDAIVLNACLVQAQFDVKKALKMAFEFSPFFHEVQHHNLASPGRSILVQQCDAWAGKLGLSLDEARRKLANKGNSVDDDHPTRTIERRDTDSTDGDSDDVEKKAAIKKKTKKVKQEVAKNGIATNQVKRRSASQVKSKKAVKGDISCEKAVEKCSIM